MECYGEKKNKIAVHVDENVSGNTRIASNVTKPLIGCASHNVNLAMKYLIHENDRLFVALDKNIAKLRYGLWAARLRKLTPFSAVLLNETRWSSSFNMLIHCVQILEFLDRLEDEEVFAVMRNTSQIQNGENNEALQRNPA